MSANKKTMPSNGLMRRATHGPLECLVQDFAQRRVGVDLRKKEERTKDNKKVAVGRERYIASSEREGF